MVPVCSGLVLDAEGVWGVRAGGESQARVTVQVGGLVQIHDVSPVTGYLSQADPRAHFGLGRAGRADRGEIRWPNGRVTRLENVRANQVLTVEQKNR